MNGTNGAGTELRTLRSDGAPTPVGAWWIVGIAYSADPARGAVPLARYGKWLRVAAAGESLDWLERVYWDAQRFDTAPHGAATVSVPGSRSQPALDLSVARMSAARYSMRPDAGRHVRLAFRAGAARVCSDYAADGAPAAPGIGRHAVYQVSRFAGRERIVDHSMTAVPAELSRTPARPPAFLQFRGHGYRAGAVPLPAHVRNLLDATLPADEKRWLEALR
jgi:hypothetical protein